MNRLRVAPVFVLATVGAHRAPPLGPAPFEAMHTFILDAGNPRSPLIQGDDGALYGTTPGGGSRNEGIVFRLTTAGELTILHEFRGHDGAAPAGGLIQATDHSIYGTTSEGGENSSGTIFKVDASNSLTTIHHFSAGEGTNPKAGLIQASDGTFYGTTEEGGTGEVGTIFRMDASGTVTALHHFSTSDGANPRASLLQASDGNFYGTTVYGGAYGYGTVFRVDPTGNLTTLHSFNHDDGAWPSSGVIETDGRFYGMTQSGGPGGFGTVFELDAAGQLSTLHSFAGEPNDGGQPEGGLIRARDGNFYGTTVYGDTPGSGTIFRMDPSGTVTIIHSFASLDGENPYAALIEGTDGNLYGTTSAGGAAALGTVFRTDLAGSLDTLTSFGSSGGATPIADLLLAADGSLIGTTAGGGASAAGIVFRIDSEGTLTRLHSFAGFPSEGSQPRGRLIESGSEFFGTTYGGGNGDYGTIFKVDSAGNLTTLHSFAGLDVEGSHPQGALVQATDGSFYGVTAYGGQNNGGTVFRMDPSGNVATIRHFGNGQSDAATPLAGLFLSADGTFYGATAFGGANQSGTVFKMDSLGQTTILHHFGGNPGDGVGPESALIQAPDGNFYGTTISGGTNGQGTIYRMDSAGNLTIVHSFTGSPNDGAHPQAALIQTTDGDFFGTTTDGGANGWGTVFRMDSEGSVTILHDFMGRPTDGSSPFAGLTEGGDGNLWGLAASGGACDKGLVFRVASRTRPPPRSVPSR